MPRAFSLQTRWRRAGPGGFRSLFVEAVEGGPLMQRST